MSDEQSDRNSYSEEVEESNLPLQLWDKTVDLAGHLDAILLIIYSWVALARVNAYPQESFDWYNGLNIGDPIISCRLFSTAVKILINKDSHKDRSVLRNVVFDNIRCLGPTLVYGFIYSG
jgi:hypothetical protein